MKIRFNNFISVLIYVIAMSISPQVLSDRLATSMVGSIEDKGNIHQRVIALAPNIVEIMYAIDAGSMIVGVSEHSDYPKEATSLPVVANYLGIQLEQVIKTKPDIVIVWKGGTPEKDINKLKSLGVTVAEFYADSIPQLISQIKAIGHLLSKKEEANKLALRIETEYQQLLITRNKNTNLNKSTASLVQNPGDTKQLKAFVEIWPEPLTTAGDKTIIGQAMALCGLTNIYADANNTYPQASLERVLVARPDVILQPNSKSNPTVVKDWSGLTILPAVENNAIISPNSDALFRWGPRLTGEIAQLCDAVRALN